MHLIIREEYDRFPPGLQGYTSYMQAAWPESSIPDENIYPEGTPEWERWGDGYWRGYIEEIDGVE